jgi:hypothetical protein
MSLIEGGSSTNAGLVAPDDTVSGMKNGITLFDIQKASKALAAVDVTPLKLSPVTHPTLYWENLLGLAKDAKERRAIRKRRRRATRYAKIAARAKPYCSVPLLGGPYTVRRYCSECHNPVEAGVPCPCWDQGIQATMTFERVYAEPKDFSKVMDETIIQLGENMATNFAAYIDAMVKATADTDWPSTVPSDIPSPVSS